MEGDDEFRAQILASIAWIIHQESCPVVDHDPRGGCECPWFLSWHDNSASDEYREARALLDEVGWGEQAAKSQLELRALPYYTRYEIY